MQCLCPAGKYLMTVNSKQCISCPKDMYCDRPSGDHSTAKRYMTRCPANTVTLRPGAKSILDCVNNQGYYYNPAMLLKRKADQLAAAVGSAVTGQQEHHTALQSAALSRQLERAAAGSMPVALPCPPNTYGTGFNFQTKCTPCLAGLKTHPDAHAGSQTSVESCLAPPGFYLSANGTAEACPAGTFSATYNRQVACTRCEDVVGPGLSTPGRRSTSSKNCHILQPGFAAVDGTTGQVLLVPLTMDQSLTGARRCPQNYTCAGEFTADWLHAPLTQHIAAHYTMPLTA
jgi:hypothetical protein